MKQARTALDAFGQATLAIAAASGKLGGKPAGARHPATPLCRTRRLRPERLLAWTRDAERARRAGQEAPALVHTQQGCRLLASFHDQTGDEEWLVVLREENDDSTLWKP